MGADTKVGWVIKSFTVKSLTDWFEAPVYGPAYDAVTYFVDLKYFTYVSAVLKGRNTSSGLYTWADVKLRP